MNRHRTLRLPHAGQLIPPFLSTLVVLLGLNLVLLPQVAMTATQPSRATPPNFAAIDTYIQAEMQATRLPGLALGIVQGDRIVHLRGFGALRHLPSLDGWVEEPTA